ncbi:MazG-like family protein [Mesorhizobium sp. 1M-11]|uniref:MazG-like family protein n=1 Tax=Mesorhizobium sp. 1M-11 TaxID=1529006 RepID=UPI0006C7595C|nr:MazG-like family protein [Mesorhizobium sp. 1M-11]
MSNALTLHALQQAHIERQKEWCPDQVPDLSFRGNEMAGETGEACNVIKKLERERHGWRGSRATKEQLAEELADVIHTAVLCAITAGIDIEPATIAKFNSTSEKNGLSFRLSALEPIEPETSLDERMKAAGMIPLSDLLAGKTPLARWMAHTGVRDMDSFEEWVAMKHREFLRMRVEYELGDKDQKDELYEWVFAHAAVFGEVAANFRQAQASVQTPTHRHVKRGTKYVLLGIGKMQAEHWRDISVDEDETALVDLREVAIYRSVDDDSLWARPREEFEDGRFEVLSQQGEQK